MAAAPLRRTVRRYRRPARAGPRGPAVDLLFERS